MSANFSKLIEIKRWLSLLLIAALIYCVFTLLKSNAYRFNPQYLVDNSILKNKTFTAEVKEVESVSPRIKAYLLEEHSNPIVSVSFLFKKGGMAYDDSSIQGTGMLLADMLTAGAGKYSMKAFHALLEQKAIQMSFHAGQDDFSGGLMFVKKDMKLAARLLNLALTQPRFDVSELKKAISLREMSFKYQAERPASVLRINALRKLYGHHPYGRNPYGRLEDFKKITATRLRSYLRKHLTLDNLVVGISGDITEDEAKRLLSEMFGRLPQKSMVKELPEPKVDFSSSEEHINYQSRQNIGMFFTSGPARLDEDFYPMIIASHILMGGSLNSRIHYRAREVEGLTYGVYGGLSNKDKINYISGEFSATADNFAKVEQIIKEEWQKIEKDGIAEDELAQSKNYLIASDLLRYANIENISETLVYMQKMKLGQDFLQKRNSYVKNISSEDVNQAVGKYFQSDRLRFMTLGTLKETGVKDGNDDK